MRSAGFFAGAVGGLALALLLVGLASLLPQTSSPLGTASTQIGNSQQVTTTLSTSAAVASKAANSSSQSIGAPSAALVAGNGAPAASSSSETTTAASSSASSVAPSSGNQVQAVGAVSSGVQAQQQKPSSLLAVLPGESVGSLIATVSPLLIGLLVAALFYGAYARRQDSAS